MPGRCVEKEAAAEGRRPLVVIGGYSAIADVDGDGKNEYVVGDYGIHVLKSDGSLLWEYAGNNLYAFALLDLDKDGKAEIVVPVHRQQFLVLNAANGQVKQWKTPSGWTPFSQSIAATTIFGPASYPSLVVANNDYQNGVALLDNNLNFVGYNSWPVPVDTYYPCVMPPPFDSCREITIRPTNAPKGAIRDVGSENGRRRSDFRQWNPVSLGPPIAQSR